MDLITTVLTGIKSMSDIMAAIKDIDKQIDKMRSFTTNGTNHTNG
jgi:hypothetical protein